MKLIHFSMKFLFYLKKFSDLYSNLRIFCLQNLTFPSSNLGGSEEISNEKTSCQFLGKLISCHEKAEDLKKLSSI
jgi:hypothetical protein